MKSARVCCILFVIINNCISNHWIKKRSFKNSDKNKQISVSAKNLRPEQIIEIVYKKTQVGFEHNKRKKHLKNESWNETDNLHR